MFDLAEAVPPIAPQTPGSVIYDRFEAEPDLLNIAVADADGRPIGLIERNAFSLKMAAQYGRSLYAGRPVTMLMDTHPRIVDGAVSTQAFTQDSLLENPSDLLRGFIVTREGRYAGVGSALSLLQAQNAAIREHAAAAQAALRAKAEFLAVMSHEIRTPLNGVLAVAEVINRRLEQKALRPYVETIVRSGETLLRLLNDALDLSRAEAGRLELQEDSFRLSTLIEDIDGLWRPRAAEAGLALTTVFEGDETLWALGDAVRLKQVLNNLVGNAIKFTRSGQVEVRLSAVVEDGIVYLGGDVIDTGPASRRTRSEPCSSPLARPRPAGMPVARAWACRSAASWSRRWAARSRRIARSARARASASTSPSTAPSIRASPASRRRSPQGWRPAPRAC